AISADGTKVAVSRPDHGPVIQPINITVPIAGSPTTTASPVATPTKTTPSPSTGPHAVNSKLPHADALAWSPDANLLVLAVNGGIQIYNAAGKDRNLLDNLYLT